MVITNNVATAGTVNTTVTDDTDLTTVTLSSAAASTLIEGSTITYTATVDHPVTGSDLAVTLSNGQVITIAVGQSSASVDYAVRADDAYIEADDVLSVTIANTTGGNYEQLATAGTVEHHGD